MRHLSAAFLLLILFGCGGGGGGGTPTAPAPTISSIALTLSDILLVGRTSNASATAMMSNGQTQAVTSGWQSSAPQVATVTDAGVVRGVGNGTSVISVSSGGQQASRSLRIAPDYDGRWDGAQIVTACRDSGDLRGICDEEFAGVIGGAFVISLTARQPDGLDVAGEFVVEQINFPTFTTTVEEDGTIRFSSVGDADGLHASVSWVMRSTVAGFASGTIVERWTFPGLAEGDLVWESTFSDLPKGTAKAQAARTQAGRRGGLVERVRAAIRR